MRPDTDLPGLPISPFAEKTTMKSAFYMLVGELMYIVINTRPEISYVVNQCSRYMTKATKKLIMKFSSTSLDILQELNICGSLGALQQH
jgi:hypothetical protein